MLEVLQNFERAAGQFKPIVLIAPGMAAVILGLFVWLGGMGLRKLVLAIVGIVIGGTLGYFVVGGNAISAAVLAAVMGLLAVTVQRVFMAVVLAGLTLFVGLFIFANVYGEIGEDQTSIADAVVERIPVATIQESLEKLQEFGADVVSAMGSGASNVPVGWWVVLAAEVIGIIIVGSFLRKPAAAMCCAMLGTMLLFVGMGLLLVHKGSAPFSRMVGDGKFYGTIFASMTLFGTIVQLVLWWRQDEKTKKAGAKGGGGDS